MFVFVIYDPSCDMSMQLQVKKSEMKSATILLRQLEYKILSCERGGSTASNTKRSCRLNAELLNECAVGADTEV